MLKKSVIALCLIAAAVSPASAQFGGIGKKLLDKAKDEAEKAILKESDDDGDAAGPKDQPKPEKPAPSSEKPAPQKSVKASGAIDVPASEMAWVAERKPFELPTTVRAFIHDPNIVAATGVRGLEIDIRRPSSGPNYHTLVLTSDSAPSQGVIRLKVDGAEIASEVFGGMDRPRGFREASVIDDMKSGKALTIELGAAAAPKAVTLPLSGFGDALSPADIDVEQGALMLSQNIGNRCVQREGKFSYKCACVQNTFVLEAPAGMHYGNAGPLLETAQAKCDANIQANPLLGQLSIQEVLFGARFSAAGAGAPEGAVVLGDMAPAGPAHAVGLRSGDMIVKVGSSAAAQRLLTEKPFRPGVQAINVYSPSTKETRTVRISLEVPPADMKMASLAPFKTAASPASAVQEKTPEPAAKAPEKNHSTSPEPQADLKKVSFTDPVGEACGRDSRLSGLYDCSCIDTKAKQVREDISDKQFAEAKEKWIPYRENQLRLSEERLAKEIDPKRIASLKQGIARTKEELEKLRTRPDPMSHPVSNVGLYTYQGASCKIDTYLKAKENDECRRSASTMSNIGDVDAYCACSANKVAALWLQSDAAYKSTLHVQMATQARTACRP